MIVIYVKRNFVCKKIFEKSLSIYPKMLYNICIMLYNIKIFMEIFEKREEN